MNKCVRIITILVIVITLCMTMVSCGNRDISKDLWQNAKYSENTTLGDGKKTVIAEVVTPQKSVTFEIKTDKASMLTLVAAMAVEKAIARICLTDTFDCEDIDIGRIQIMEKE